MSKKRVLFLCTGNSARSQMAEGLLRHIAGEKYDIVSAGTHPKGVHPMTVQVMREAGVDISGHTSKDVQRFLGEKFDYVITVCDRAKRECPIFPGAEPIHWGFDDPAEAPSGSETRTFRRVREEIMQRLRLFVLSITTDPTSVVGYIKSRILITLKAPRANRRYFSLLAR